MLRGLWKLTWIEIKVFLREPLGAIGTIGIPVLVFLVAGRMIGRKAALTSPAASSFIGVGLPVLASVLILIAAVAVFVFPNPIARAAEIVDHDLRALPGQRPAERAAEPPAAAGHHRHPPGQRRVTHDPSQPDWPERAGFIVTIDGPRCSVYCSVATAVAEGQASRHV